MSSITVFSGRAIHRLSLHIGETALQLLQRERIYLPAECGGNGTCGKCSITVQSSAGSQVVLACAYRPQPGDILILPESSGGVIEVNTPGVQHVQSRQGFGAAVDLGTTTIVAELYDLGDGKRLAVQSDWNAQRVFGADVITRAQYTLEQADGLKLLSRTVREQILGMLGLMCLQHGISLTELREIVIAGNTVMQHLLLGLSPEAIVHAPFRPDELFRSGRDWHFPEYAGCSIYPFPCAAGFVGGDITAGLLSSAVGTAKHGTELFLDIGTNGEMVLQHEGRLLCCSVATGPAFEGASISCGMASISGAVKHAMLQDDEIRFETVDDAPIRGICGSGLIDLLAILLDCGMIDGGGRLLSPEDLEDEERTNSIPEKLLRQLEEDADENGIFYLDAAHTVSLRAADVRQVQLARAAVSAGIRYLIRKAGLTLQTVDHVWLAGGFGSSLNLDSAGTIGLLPQELLNRTVCIGNSALSGAAQVLLQPSLRSRISDICEICEYYELSGDAEFASLYVEQMPFYETDEEDE